MFQTHSKFPLQKTVFWTDLFRSVNPPQLQIDNCFWGGVKLGDISYEAGQGKQQPKIIQRSEFFRDHNLRKNNYRGGKTYMVISCT